MAELRTEEEQIEALQRWWNNNGRSLLIGIGVAIAGVLGWNYYQDSQQQHAEQASAYFQRLLTSAASNDWNEVSISAVAQDAARLKSEFGGTVYAQYAALMLAKLAVEAERYADAETELRWVIDQADAQSELSIVSTIRLALVLHAQDQSDTALGLLADQDDAWQSRRLEVKGDILAAQGDLSSARQAYLNARQLASQQGINSALLNLKLDNLAVNPS